MKIKEIFFPQLDKNITFWVGKNAQDNFDIIDNADENDLWFHLHGYQSGHVIAKIPENIHKEQMRFIVKWGAILCKQQSRFSSLPKIEVIYTKVKNVKKTNIIGCVECRETKKITC